MSEKGAACSRNHYCKARARVCFSAAVSHSTGAHRGTKFSVLYQFGPGAFCNAALRQPVAYFLQVLSQHLVEAFFFLGALTFSASLMYEMMTGNGGNRLLHV